MFTTTPQIITDKLVSLADPKFNFAAQNVIPLVYKPALTPTISSTLNAVSAKLTTERPAADGQRGHHRQGELHHRRRRLPAVRRPGLSQRTVPRPLTFRRQASNVRGRAHHGYHRRPPRTQAHRLGQLRPGPAGAPRGAADPDRRGHRGQRLPVQSRPRPGADRRADRHRRQAVAARRGPARHRQALAADGEPRPLPVTAHRRHGRRRPVGHRGQGGEPARPPAPRHLQGPHPRLLLHRPPQDRGGVRGGSPLLAGPGLEGLQAPPAARPLAPARLRAPGRLRHRGVRGGQGSDRRRHDADARLLVVLLLHRRPQGRPGDHGPRLPLVRGPVPHPRHAQLRPARQAPEHPAARHRDQPGRPRRPPALDHQRRHRLPARRRGHQGRHHRPDEDRPPGRGLRHELRGPRLLQRAEQRRRPARHDGHRQLRLARGPRVQPRGRPQPRPPQLRPHRAVRRSTPTATCTPRPAPASARPSTGTSSTPR